MPARTVLEQSMEIDRPQGEVFRFIADPQNDPQWCPRVLWCRQTEGSEPAVGARYEALHHPSLNRPHIRRIEVLESDPPHRIVTVQEDQVAEFRITYTLRSTPRGTEIIQRDEIDWRVPRLGVPIGRRIVRAHLHDQLADLKSLLEGAGTAATAGAGAATAC